jgi:hypothetical protein
MKRNILKLALEIFCLCLATYMVANSSIAYFSDTKASSATMTSGNVTIGLSESAVIQDAAGNLVADPSAPRIQGAEDEVLRDYGVIFPGQTICRDPLVANTGDHDAWIAVKVTISDGSRDIHKLIGYPDFHAVDIEMLLSGGLLDEKVHVGDWNGFKNVCYNDRYAMVQVEDPKAEEYVFYFFMLEKQPKGSEILVFDTMQFPLEWTGTDMQELTELRIGVRAFAVQTFGFSSCLDAMTAAFDNYFELGR